MVTLMTVLLVTWVCASIALCLAFLSAAARPAPRMDEQMAAEGEPVLRQETPGALAGLARLRAGQGNRRDVAYDQSGLARGPAPLPRLSPAEECECLTAGAGVR